mmetsp:Transcript_23194/g.30954  ORF Transcript_23194/g.30954 Transcript_23194/m.30954 type:complete len:243 (-) Transcript_23194:922-1650(-)
MLLSLTLRSVQVLFSLGFALKDSTHDFLFLGVESVIVKSTAHRHHRHGTVAVTDRSHRTVDLDGGQDGIGDLLRVGNLVLPVEEVPDIEETVHAGQEEKTGAGGRPAAIGQVRRMIARLHNGMALEILTPDFGAPVTNGQEVLQVAGVPLNVVDGAVMLALLQAELKINFDLLALVSLQDVTLLGTDEVFQGGGIRVVLETRTAEHLRLHFTVHVKVLYELELLEGTTLKVSLIPPEKATIS